jgi:hypothetical protein
LVVTVALAGEAAGVEVGVEVGLAGGEEEEEEEEVAVVVAVLLLTAVVLVGVVGGDGELLRSLSGDTGDRAAAAAAAADRGLELDDSAPTPAASGLSGATGLRFRLMLIVPPVCNRGGLAFTLSFSLPAQAKQFSHKVLSHYKSADKQRFIYKNISKLETAG